MKRLNEIKMFNFRFSFLGYIIFLSFTLRKIFVSGSVFFAFFFSRTIFGFWTQRRKGGRTRTGKESRQNQTNQLVHTTVAEVEAAFGNSEVSIRSALFEMLHFNYILLNVHLRKDVINKIFRLENIKIF